jgi:hypothetical protein
MPAGSLRSFARANRSSTLGRCRPLMAGADTGGAARRPPPHASAQAVYGAVMAGQLFPLLGFGSVHTIRPWIDGVMGVFAVT